MFKTNFSGRNKFWGALPPNAPPVATGLSSATTEMPPNFSGCTLPLSGHGDLLLQDIRLLIFRQLGWGTLSTASLQVPLFQSRLGSGCELF